VSVTDLSESGAKCRTLGVMRFLVICVRAWKVLIRGTRSHSPGTEELTEAEAPWVLTTRQSQPNLHGCQSTRRQIYCKTHARVDSGAL
jgi:hypothetical protein